MIVTVYLSSRSVYAFLKTEIIGLFKENIFTLKNLSETNCAEDISSIELI